MKYYDNDSKKYKYSYKMECLITTEIESLIETYNNKFEKIKAEDAFFNSEELIGYKRINETELSNNSTIILK